MKHLGDIKGISGYEAPIVDVITGGSPCQDLSTAGARKGLAGERSGLFMEQMRIVREMRERDVRENGRAAWAVRPRYMVWENVPGAFSSGKPKGADFASVLEEIIKVAEPNACVQVCVPDGGWTKSGCYYSADGQWSIAWRLHDAQFWGVAQRRKRIALVADFGGLSAPEILFERKGLSWNLEQGFSQGQAASEKTESGVGSASYTLKIRGGVDVDSNGKAAGKGALIQTELSGTIGVSQDQTLIQPSLMDAFQHHGYRQNDTCGTLTKDQNCGIRGDTPLVVEPVAYGISAYNSNAMKSDNPNSGIYKAETSRTLDLNGGSPACNQGGVAIVQESDPNPKVSVPLDASYYKGAGERNGVERTVVCMGNGQLAQMTMAEISNALDCMHDQQAVVVSSDLPDTVGAICSTDHKGIRNQDIEQDKCLFTGVVRRLTPDECASLQGFPRDWCNIGEWTDSKGKKHKDADSPKYKAYGNSIAVGYANNQSGFWCWLARRICAQYERQVTMASLFDGIGGFPLAFQSCGALPVWASEIEEFPIAVTKVRFPE